MPKVEINSYNLQKIFNNVLRISGGIYFGSPDSIGSRDALTPAGSLLRKSNLAMGRPYFMPVFLGGQEIPLAVISATTKKTIVETPMAGRAGTVKELISKGDYSISLSGILIGEDYPSEEVARIKELYDRDETLEIKCVLTDILLSQKNTSATAGDNPFMAVITSIDWPAMGAVENMQAFTMKLVSDNPYNLYDIDITEDR